MLTGRFFTMGDMMGAMASLQILAAIALPRLGAALNAVAPLYQTFSYWYTWAEVGWNAVAGSAAWGNFIVNRLEEMAFNAQGATVSYSPGFGPRGLQFGEAADQNLTDSSEAIDDFHKAQRTAISIKHTITARNPQAFVQTVGNWAAELDGWDHPVLVKYRNGGQEMVDPRTDVDNRGLLVGVDVDDIQSWGGNARWVNNQLRQLNKTFGVAIRLVPIRQLRGR